MDATERMVGDVVAVSVFGDIIKILESKGISKDAMFGDAEVIASLAREEVKATMDDAFEDASEAFAANMGAVAEATFIASFKVASAEVANRYLTFVRTGKV